MPFKLTVTSTKPAGTTFFRQSSPENRAKMDAINAWTAQQPGFISVDNIRLDENTAVQHLVFDTAENYAAYNEARRQQTDHVDRLEYNVTNGITSERVEETVSE
jgi:antibiotic biosynthesis monooxygenase (ABM) superfamily enzyme